MSGNPRWIYGYDGSPRQPHDFTALLAGLAAAADGGREASSPRSAGSADRGVLAGGSATAAGAGVRVPVTSLKRLQEVMQRHS